uniref:RING-type E3 ubiquitin transferase n=1 Tax=Otolemur garnettii TaxID=30611 RepID=H0Y1T3_OTOGA
MENSSSDHEEDVSAVQIQNHMDRLDREEAYYRFVTNLSDEDYRLMRDNDLFGIIGESTEEELKRRLELIKEELEQETDENTGEGEFSDYTSSSSDSASINWITVFGNPENMAGREERENLTCIAANQTNPSCDDCRVNLGEDFNLSNQSLNPENECASSAGLPRMEYTESSQRQVEFLQPMPTDGRPSRSERRTTVEDLVEAPPTRSRRRARSKSPDYRITRARIESRSSPISWGENSQFDLNMPSQNVEQPLGNETERCSLSHQPETLRQQITAPELQNRDIFGVSAIRDAFPGERSPETNRNGDLPTPSLTSSPTGLEVIRINPGEYLPRLSRGGRIQLGSEPNTITIESEQEAPRNMFSHSEQPDVRTYFQNIRIPVRRILSTGLNDAPFTPHHSPYRQAVAGFGDFMNGDSPPNIPPASQNTGAESQKEQDDSGIRGISGARSNPGYDSFSSSISSTTSSSNYLSTSSSSPVSISSSSNENSEMNTLFEFRNERSSLSEPSQQRTSEVTEDDDDDDDSWPFLNLAQFFVLNDDDDGYEPTGLTKQQIDNLAVRNFDENDTSKICSVCITEYTEGNKLRVLPCSHEYHVHCIDRWLSDNSTCPICRNDVLGSNIRK